MKFLLEADLEKLAKWLRFLGQDAELLKGHINKRDVLKYPNRVFVTTSRKWEKHLKAWGVDHFLIPKDDWEVQLCLLLKHFSIEPKLKLNRCPYCNWQLEPIDKEKIKDRIPSIVYEFADDFTVCPKCDAIFWKGTHFPKMRKMLKDVLKRC